MLHGRFTASNEGATTGFETLAEITDVPKERQWTEIKLPVPVRYRFKEFFADGIHLTAKGRYFVSLIHYACLYNESPEGRVSKLNSGLTDEQAKRFEQIAWQTVWDAMK